MCGSVEDYIFALTLTYSLYSFDPDVQVHLFATKDEASTGLKKQFEKKLRTQTEENGHIDGEYPEYFSLTRGILHLTVELKTFHRRVEFSIRRKENE